MIQVYYGCNRAGQAEAVSESRLDQINQMKKGSLERRNLARRKLVRFCVKCTASLALCCLLSCRKSPPTVAAIPRTCGTLLWEAEHTGLQSVASTSGINIYWNAPMREDDVQGQIDVLTSAIGRGARGVIISPVEALPLRTPVQRALDHGTPIVVVGSDLGLAPGKNLAYVLNDERTGGQMAARRIGGLLGGEGTVAVMGISNRLTSTAARDRSLETTLAQEFPGIHVVFRSLALPTVSQEQQVAERLLLESPNIGVIVALSEFSTRGAYYALTENERTPAIRLIGFDQNLIAPIRTGAIDSVIMQNTYQMGRAAMTLMVQELHEGAMEHEVWQQPVLVTKTNLDSTVVREILDLSWFTK
ncbi:MAG TPA: substrate-binding domain-containing protein [Acidisarcina sp.]